MAKILAVDDSASMRDMVAFTLRTAGHEVVQAEDGKDALAEADRFHADLVLTDINMPHLDGISLTRELRGHQHYRLVPILILTTESSRERKLEGKAAGATGWIVKPFDPDTLLTTIDRLLG